MEGDTASWKGTSRHGRGHRVIEGDTYHGMGHPVMEVDSLVPRPQPARKGVWGQCYSQLDPMTLMSGMWDGQSEFS